MFAEYNKYICSTQSRACVKNEKVANYGCYHRMKCAKQNHFKWSTTCIITLCKQLHPEHIWGTGNKAYLAVKCNLFV